MAAVFAQIVPASLLLTSLSITAPIMDLREIPASSGRLKDLNSLKYLKRQLYPYFLMYLGYSKEEILNRMMEDKIIFELDKYTYERGLATVDLKTFIDFCIKNQKHILKISELEII